MAETEGYIYRVLTPVLAIEGTRGKRHLIDLGEHGGRTPIEAIEHAVKDGGLPSEDGGRCVAVPVSRWHEADVTIKQVPEVRVLSVQAPSADDITADPA